MRPVKNESFCHQKEDILSQKRLGTRLATYWVRAESKRAPQKHSLNGRWQTARLRPQGQGKQKNVKLKYN